MALARDLMTVLLAWMLGVVGSHAQGLRFEETVRRLPAMTETDTARHRLTFRLTAESPLTITRVHATCGCTRILHYPTHALKSGSRDSIVAEYRTLRRGPGTVDEPIHVYTTLDADTPATLHVVGDIDEAPEARWSHLTEAMGPIRLRRKAVTFAPGDRVMRIPCANTSPAPVRIRPSLLPPYVSVTTQPEVIEPGTEADIVIRIDRAKAPEARPLRAAVILDGIACDITQRQLKLTIE